jgi:hypothetical protein
MPISSNPAGGPADRARIMTKTMAIADFSVSTLACSADPSDGKRQVSAPNEDAPNVVDPAKPATVDAADPCAKPPAPRKTPGLLEQCDGAYLCKFGDNINGDDVYVHFDGTRCVASKAGSVEPMVFSADGHVIEGDWVGTWQGDAIGWSYRFGTRTMSCAPQGPR